MESLKDQNSWKVNRLIVVHGVIFLFSALYFIPSSRIFLHSLDIHMAYLFNSLGKLTTFTPHFWAFFNSRAADWIYDVVIFAFFFTYIFNSESKERKKRCLHTLLLILLTVSSYLLINRVFFGKIIVPRRISPTGPLEDLFRISSVVTWVKVKEYATSTFPADHASTVWMFILSQFHLRGKKWGLYAFFASLPFLLARLVSGAHWWSDVFLGSFLIVLFDQAWVFYSPAFSWATSNLLTLLRWKNGKKQLKSNL